jgi:hypothetical protein
MAGVRRTIIARAAASVILAGALVLGTSGCTFLSTQATLIQYDPSDGVGADIGNLHVRNVFAVANESGDAVSLVITIVNPRQGAANVNLQFESNGEKTTVSKPVSGNSVSTYGTTPDENQIVIANPDVEPGELLPVYVQYGKYEGEQLLVPVLEATGHYEGLGPAEAE